MTGKSELKCKMSGQTWGWLVGGLIALVAGLYLAVHDDLHPLAPIAGLIVVGAGIVLLVCVALTRRNRLVADEEGLTYSNWRSSQSIPWKRLSSIQMRAEGSRVNELVVVNDSGRAHMTVPARQFDAQRLHDWLGTLPTRVPGRHKLLG